MCALDCSIKTSTRATERLTATVGGAAGWSGALRLEFSGVQSADGGRLWSADASRTWARLVRARRTRDAALHHSGAVEVLWTFSSIMFRSNDLLSWSIGTFEQRKTPPNHVGERDVECEVHYPRGGSWEKISIIPWKGPLVRNTLNLNSATEIVPRLAAGCLDPLDGPCSIYF